VNFGKNVLAALSLVCCAMPAAYGYDEMDELDAQTRVEARTHRNVGQMLTDSKGMSLYIFEKDIGGGRSACYDACTDTWPPLLTDEAPVAGAGTWSTKISYITRTDGTKQVTYAGWPLYYFAADKLPGDIKGQSTSGFGAGWYVMSPQGLAIKPAPRW